VVGVGDCMAGPGIGNELPRYECRYGNGCEVWIAVLDLGVLYNTCIAIDVI